MKTIEQPWARDTFPDGDANCRIELHVNTTATVMSQNIIKVVLTAIVILVVTYK